MLADLGATTVALVPDCRGTPGEAASCEANTGAGSTMMSCSMNTDWTGCVGVDASDAAVCNIGACDKVHAASATLGQE